MINWLVIHKSTQLKGIASDKYLVCKYAYLKLGENLCPQRIGVYNKVEEIDFEQLIKKDNVVLKISNGCGDNIFIRNKTIKDIENIRQKVIKAYNRNYPFYVPSLFHFYSKKRIVLEKLFSPIYELYEFKIILINCDIKFIYLRVYINNKLKIFQYDKNFNPIYKNKNKDFNISFFNKKILNKIKFYAVKLSEDFKNFIRVDLYIFKGKIYLSELTFDANDGMPTSKDKLLINEVKNWKRDY